MTKSDAKIICDWKYPNEYSVYNVGGQKFAKKNKWAISKFKTRKQQFRTVFDEDKEIIGYFRFKEQAEKTTLGLGLNPKKCGKGFGKNSWNSSLIQKS